MRDITKAVEARAGLPELQFSAGFKGLTGENGTTENCGVQGGLSNLCDPPPKQKESPRTGGNRDEGETTSLRASGRAGDNPNPDPVQLIAEAFGVTTATAAKLADRDVRLFRGQTFQFVGNVPHLTRDGRKVQLVVWRSLCAECGTEFETKTPARAKRFEPARRCERHRAPGKRIGRAAA